MVKALLVFIVPMSSLMLLLRVYMVAYYLVKPEKSTEWSRTSSMGGEWCPEKGRGCGT